MKILASDYDGTLNHGGIDDRKRTAIARWRAAGNRFGIVSGRPAADLPGIIARDGIECDFLLSCNGAVISTPEGRVLDDCRCDGSVADPLIRALWALGCPWVNVTARVSCKLEKGGEIPGIAWFNQMNVQLCSEDEANLVTGAVRERFGAFVNPLQNGICVDIVPAGMDKAEGLRRLLKLYRAEEGDLITVGDHINDTAMIAAFRSYAMENAVDAIKELADAVTPGIAELIEWELG